MAGVTPCLLPIKLKGKNEGLVSSLKMPYCEKMVDEMPCCKTVDEMLLGLLSDAEELCFPEFEILDDVENCDLMVLGKCTEVCGYMELIDLNGSLNLESGFCAEKIDSLENSEGSEDKCWSMAVNIEDKDLGTEHGAWSWFQSFRNPAVVKVDTGQNLRYCFQVLGSLLGALWDIVQSLIVERL